MAGWCSGAGGRTAPLPTALRRLRQRQLRQQRGDCHTDGPFGILAIPFHVESTVTSKPHIKPRTVVQHWHARHR